MTMVFLAPSLHRLAALPSTSTNDSFPLKVSVQTPEEPDCFLTPKAIHHYGSVSLRSHAHPLSNQLRLEEQSPVLLKQWRVREGHVPLEWAVDG